jgi:hypothetical protein
MPNPDQRGRTGPRVMRIRREHDESAAPTFATERLGSTFHAEECECPRCKALRAALEQDAPSA